jgi:proteasome lid subunit RPN8/RPN11
LSGKQASSGPALTFVLSQEMHAAIVDHARRDAPRECCGVITGRHRSPSRLIALHNVAEGNRFYEIDPLQLIELEFQELPKDDSDILAIYHSHPESPAYPSKTDLELAYWPEAVYLICSLESPDAPLIRGFYLRDGLVTEVTLIR